MDRLEVARFMTLPEAELAAALLREHGIDTRVPDRNSATSMAYMQVAFGGLRVTAPDSQIVQARDLIARAGAGEFERVAGEDDEAWREGGTPGLVGDFPEDQIRGALGPLKSLFRYVAAGILIIATLGFLGDLVL